MQEPRFGVQRLLKKIFHFCYPTLLMSYHQPRWLECADPVGTSVRNIQNSCMSCLAMLMAEQSDKWIRTCAHARPLKDVVHPPKKPLHYRPMSQKQRGLSTKRVERVNMQQSS